MIEGLKVTVIGSELKKLCECRAAHHRERASVYGEQLANFEKAEVEGMEYSNGDPKRNLRDKKAFHDAESSELRFIAEHLDLSESYLLGRDDLVKLGISSRGY